MENMSKEEFMRQSEAAVRRMRELNNRANIKSSPHKMPPTPPFVSSTAPEEQKVKESSKERPKNNNSNSGLSLPFLDMFKNDSDMPIILGLLLLLMSEKCDKRLLFALLYILM